MSDTTNECGHSVAAIGYVCRDCMADNARRLATTEAERDRAVEALTPVAWLDDSKRDCGECGHAVWFCDKHKGVDCNSRMDVCHGFIARQALAPATPGVASPPLQPVTLGRDDGWRPVWELVFEQHAQLSRGTGDVCRCATCIDMRRALATPPVPEKD